MLQKTYMRFVANQLKEAEMRFKKAEGSGGARRVSHGHIVCQIYPSDSQYKKVMPFEFNRPVYALVTFDRDMYQNEYPFNDHEIAIITPASDEKDATNDLSLHVNYPGIKAYLSILPEDKKLTPVIVVDVEEAPEHECRVAIRGIPNFFAIFDANLFNQPN